MWHSATPPAWNSTMAEIMTFQAINRRLLLDADYDRVFVGDRDSYALG